MRPVLIVALDPGIEVGLKFGDRPIDLLTLGSASINVFNRTTAAFRGIRARLVAPCQGSTLSRATAESTVSRVPFRSSPIDAPRNSSNSDRMSGDNAA
jgi:hypothetical protein